MPSRANSRTAACRMAVRVSSGRPRDPSRGRAGAVGMVDSLLTNQLVRLYKAHTGWTMYVNHRGHRGLQGLPDPEAALEMKRIRRNEVSADGVFWEGRVGVEHSLRIHLSLPTWRIGLRVVSCAYGLVYPSPAFAKCAIGMGASGGAEGGYRTSQEEQACPRVL